MLKVWFAHNRGPFASDIVAFAFIQSLDDTWAHAYRYFYSEHKLQSQVFDWSEISSASKPTNQIKEI